MNLGFEAAQDLVLDLSDQLQGYHKMTEVVICPPFPFLELATDLAEEHEGLFYAGAQNCSQFSNGAYTGEVSAEILSSIGTGFCLVGHSERRKYFNETNAMVAEKVTQLLKHKINPVVCCGEQLEDRKAGKHFQVVENQIVESLFHVDKRKINNVIIAYEPVWAIGTSETATPAQAQEMHAFIRQLLEKKYGTETAYNFYIIYGGSCNATNALDLFSQEDVDGGLIGGASLEIDDFMRIIEAAETATKED